MSINMINYETKEAFVQRGMTYLQKNALLERK